MSRRNIGTALSFVLVNTLVLGSACSKDAADAGSDGPRTTETVGTFQVELVSAVEATNDTPARDAFVSVLGRVYEHPVPSLVVWEQSDETSGCQLFVPRVPFCNPACASGEACVDDQICKAFPESYDLGAVTIEGIATETGATLSMDPLPPSNTYQPLASAGIAYPPFGAGDPVSLRTEGGALDAFSIESTGIEELVLTEPAGDLPFASGEPATLAWEPSNNAQSRVEVIIDISHHGGQKGEIRCSVPDNGSLTIPEKLVTGLIDLGFSGFPSAQISRVAVGSTTTSAGNVELKVMHTVTRFIEIPGLVSCEETGSTEGCPDGETCQDDLKCA